MSNVPVCRGSVDSGDVTAARTRSRFTGRFVPQIYGLVLIGVHSRHNSTEVSAAGLRLRELNVPRWLLFCRASYVYSQDSYDIMLYGLVCARPALEFQVAYMTGL